MKVLLYPSIYKNYGTGNILRMICLYNYLRKSKKIQDIIITSNDIALSNGIIQSIYKNSTVKLYYIEKHQNYDVVIYDSPKADLTILKELRQYTKNLIALDFFDYQNKYIDVIINLFNHKRDEINKFKGRLYEGIQYCILKSEILTERKENIIISKNKPKTLITFGGEDPNSNTLRVLQGINSHEIDVKVIIGHLHKDRKKIINIYSNTIEIIDPTHKIGQLIVNSDIIICGGGTTLLEAIYLGNPIVAISQNKLEKDFIDKIKKTIPLFDLEDIPMLISKVKDISFRMEIKERYTNFLDGQGKKRLEEIILEERKNEKNSDCWSGRVSITRNYRS